MKITDSQQALTLSPRYFKTYQHVHHLIHFSPEWQAYFVIHEKWWFDYELRSNQWRLIRVFRPKMCQTNIAPDKEVHERGFWNNEIAFWRSEDDDQPQWYGDWKRALDELRELYRWQKHKRDQAGCQVFYNQLKTIIDYDNLDDFDRDFFIEDYADIKEPSLPKQAQFDKALAKESQFWWETRMPENGLNEFALKFIRFYHLE